MTSPGDPFTGRCAVVADDEPLQCKLTLHRLRRLGFVVHTASNAAAALCKAREVRPDVVVSDVLMPGSDGFALCAALRSDPELARVPVILLTNGYLEECDRARATRAGATAYVARTPDFRELFEVLREILSDTPRP